MSGNLPLILIIFTNATIFGDTNIPVIVGIHLIFRNGT